MFTDANYKFCSNCLGLWVKCRRQFICLGFYGDISAWWLQMKSTSYLEDNRDVTTGRWWAWISCWWVKGTGGTAVIEQWIENALVSQGRAEGWAIISRGEALAECRGLTHLASCFSWVSHLAVTNIKGSSSQASEQGCWEQRSVLTSLCAYALGRNARVLVSFSCCAGWFCLLLSYFRKSGWWETSHGSSLGMKV